MSWLWSYWSKKDDPLADLDPTLREFLEKESPSKYNPSATPSASQSYRQQLGLSHNSPEAQHSAAHASSTPSSGTLAAPHAATSSSDRPLPAESLFPDGRYKDLWSTYRPAREVAEAGKSDSEKLLDIVAGYKERQAGVGRAALENCADEQWAVHECFRSGGWRARMQMCRQENRGLERCVLLQSRFLRALGYLSMYERSQEDSERIQMHADVLYHRMLEEERAIKEAKERGEQVPVGTAAALIEPIEGHGPPVVGEDSVRPRVGTVQYETLPDAVKAKVRKARFEGLDGQELELAQREMDQEIAVNQVLIQQLDERYTTERRERLQRLAEGRERMSDKVKRWFDMRKYDEQEKPLPPEKPQKPES